MMTRSATFLCGVFLIYPNASAQGRGGFGGGFAGDALADVKTQIRASDEEWKVIGPKLREVMTARQAVESFISAENQINGMDFARGPGGPGGRGGNDTFSGPSDQSGGGRGGPGGRRGGFGPPDGQGFDPNGGPGDFPPDGGFRRGPRGGFGPPDFAGGPDGGFGPGGGRGGRGGGPGGPGGRGGNAVLSAMNDLQITIKDPQATADQIKEKVAAVRVAREKAKAKLESAQKELLLLLTADQQAVLVEQGIID